MNILKWKWIKGYEGLYKIGTNGVVKTFHKSNKFKNQSECIMKPYVNHGYAHVSLVKEGKRKAHKVHRLLAVAFIKNPKNKPFVNHKNGIKSDNSLKNLEWCTAAENIRHAFANGLMDDRSKPRPWMRKPIIQIDADTGKIIQEWDSATSAGNALGFDDTGIRNCLNKKSKTSMGYIWKFKYNKNKLLEVKDG